MESKRDRVGAERLVTQRRLTFGSPTSTGIGHGHTVPRESEIVSNRKTSLPPPASSCHPHHLPVTARRTPTRDTSVTHTCYLIMIDPCDTKRKVRASDGRRILPASESLPSSYQVLVGTSSCSSTGYPKWLSTWYRSSTSDWVSGFVLSTMRSSGCFSCQSFGLI
jgi:hypothetical protein